MAMFIMIYKAKSFWLLRFICAKHYCQWFYFYICKIKAFRINYQIQCLPIIIPSNQIKIILEMLKQSDDCFHNYLTRSKTRPQTSITQKSKDSYTSTASLQRRIKHAYQIQSITDLSMHCPTKLQIQKLNKSKIDTEEPSIVYNWLDQFEESIAKKSVGTSFYYPIAKYQQSARLVDSKGYKSVKTWQRQEKLPNFIKDKKENLQKIHYKLNQTEEGRNKEIKNSNQ